MCSGYLVLIAASSLLVSAAGITSSLQNVASDPEIDYDALELITSKGYPGEAHWVQTPDGYILGLHRIPHGKGQQKGPRPVFFLQHGLLCSSTNWLTNLVNESLAYILADNGFDVWMGNVRGNTYSRNHTTLKVNSKEFWDFTFDEHSQIDLPTMLDYVLKITGQEKLFYVGHSQGTVMGFAGFTFNQSLATHIETFFALAPVSTVKYIKGVFKVISDYSDELDYILSRTTDGEFLPSDFLVKFFAKHVCTADMEVMGLCGDIIFLICGFDQENLNTSRVPVYFTHTPAGTSLKNALHFSQEVKSGRFAMFDYNDEKKNIQHYGISPSPAYNVSEIAVPMVLFSGTKDWLADPQDVAELIPKINTTGKVIYHKNVDYYDHLDFIWAMDAANVIYKDIVSIAHKRLFN